MRRPYISSAVFVGLLAGAIVLGGDAMSQSSRGALTASPSAGGAPLTVTFNGHANGATFFGGVTIAFGDGTSERFCPPGRGCRDTVATHTYKAPGRYTASLVGNGEPSETAIASVAVTVR